MLTQNMTSPIDGFSFDDWLVSIGQEIMVNGWKTENIPETVKDWFSGKVLRALPPRLIQKFIGFLLDNRDIDGSIAIREMNDEEFHILIYKSEKTRLRREKDEAAEQVKLDNMARNPTPEHLAYIQHKNTEYESIESRKNHTLIFDENGTTEDGLKFFCDEVIQDPLYKKEIEAKNEKLRVKLPEMRKLPENRENSTRKNNYQNDPDTSLPSLDKSDSEDNLNSDEEQKLNDEVRQRILVQRKRKKQPKNLPCETCGKCFENPSRLKRHVRQVHNSENPNHISRSRGTGPSERQLALECPDVLFDEKMDKWSCKLCGKQNTRPGHIVRHVKTVHYKDVAASCSICGTEFTDTNSLKRHMLKHDGYQIECQWCLKKYQTKWKKMEHVKRHHPLEYAQEIIDNSMKENVDNGMG
jgi:hypothetical protein